MAYCNHCGAQVANDANVCRSCGKRLGWSGKKGCWFAFLGCGCLVVVAVVVLVAALVAPSFESAREKVEQKRTVAEMRNVGTALMSWYVDHGDGPELAELPELPSADDLARILVPDYIAEVPAVDGWGHELEYWIYRVRSPGRFVRIRSPGRDGIFEAESYTSETFPASDLDRDVVWADGYFVRWPE